MEYTHALNRGVDKRAIVLNDSDRARFVTDLYVMNDSRRVFNLDYHTTNTIDVRRQYSERDRLVTIHAWCVMGNHYHLLLSEVQEGGMAVFLKKLNMGYAKYFNTKYNRSGALFQGKTKRVQITTDRQFLYILPYIHLNPLDLHRSYATWRSQSLSDTRGALQYLSDYRWSSYRNYLGEVDQADILEGSNLFSDKQTFVQEMRHVLTSMHDEDLADTRLE